MSNSYRKVIIVESFSHNFPLFLIKLSMNSNSMCILFLMHITNKLKLRMKNPWSFNIKFWFPSFELNHVEFTSSAAKPLKANFSKRLQFIIGCDIKSQHFCKLTLSHYWRWQGNLCGIFDENQLTGEKSLFPLFHLRRSKMEKLNESVMTRTQKSAAVVLSFQHPVIVGPNKSINKLCLGLSPLLNSKDSPLLLA